MAEGGAVNLAAAPPGVITAVLPTSAGGMPPASSMCVAARGAEAVELPDDSNLSNNAQTFVDFVLRGDRRRILEISTK